MRKFLLNLFLFFGAVGIAGAQTYTTTHLTGPETGSPLIGGSTNNVIFAFTVAKAGGGAANLTEVVVTTGSTNPNSVFSSVQLLSSATNFASASATGATPQLNTGDIKFTGAPVYAFAGGGETRNFYLVATVRPDVVTTSGGVPSITFTMTQANTLYSAGTASAFSFSRPNVEFEALTMDITQETGGVPSSITAGATNQAIIGMSIVSNGTQSVDDLVFTLDIDPATGPLSGFQIVNNGASATYSGGGTILPAVPTIGASTVTFTNLGQAVDDNPKYFFLIADVSAAATPQNFNTTLTSATADIANETGFPFSQGPTAIAGLTTTFAPITGGLTTSPVTEGDQAQAILGFSATSNGASTLTAIEFPVTPTGVDLTDYFGSIKLYSSTNATFGGSDVEIVDAGGYTVDLSDPDKIIITNLAQSLTTTTKYYFLVADIASDISAIRGSTLKVELNAADITVNGIADVPAAIESVDYKFLYSLSSVVTVSDDGQSSLDAADYIYQGPLNDNTMGERVFAIQIADADTDQRPTKVTSLTFKFGDHQNLDSVALFVNGTTAPLARVKVSDVVDASDQIQFSITPPAGDVLEDADKTYSIYVSFKPTVTDLDRITVQLMEALADTTQGTGIAPFGTLQTNATDNDIDVDVTKLVIDPAIATSVGPGATFPVIVYAQDNYGNLDLNYGEKVHLKITGGSGTLTGGTDVDDVNGVFSFVVSIDAAGTYTLEAEDNSDTAEDPADDTKVINVNSPGVRITNGYTGSPFDRDLCFGLKTYDTLGTIKIAEQDRGDFAGGGYYMFELPPGFIFNTAKAPTITETGNEVTLNPFGSTSSYYVGNNIFRFRFTIGGTTDPVKDAITIKDLEVIPDSTFTGLAGGEIHMLDAGSVMIGNAESDLMSHGNINLTIAPPTDFDFEVAAFPGQTPFVPEETQFSYTVFGVLLKPSPSNPASSYPVFQGNGVSRSNTQNAYVFSPSAVGVGSNYNISFTVRDDASGCKVTRTKVFTVYATSISGLLTEYCENDSIAKPLSVSKDRYSPAKYYPNWDNTAFYTVNSRVNYNGDAYMCILATTASHEPPTNATYWKEFGYTFSNEYSITIPSYKTISSVDNDGVGTITITSPNHGFSNGAKLYLGYYVYDANWNIVFSIPYPTGDESTYYTLSNVTTNTFDISYSHPGSGIYSGGYGYVYIQNPQVTGVTSLNNLVTITVPNHGLSTGATVRIYLQGLSGNGITTNINGWYPITKIDNNTFTITTTNNVTGVWSGYGFVDIFTYKISTFKPSMASSLNTNFGSVTDIYVGFMVRSIGCVTTASNPCSELVYSQEPVKLNQLAEVDFEGLNASGEYCANSVSYTLTGNQVDGFFTGAGITDGGDNNPGGIFKPVPALEDSTFVITYTFTDNKNCTAEIGKTVTINETPPLPTATPSQFGYCVGDTQPLILKISGTGNDFAWYDDNSKTTLLGNGPVFDASSEGTGSPKTVSFFVTQFSEGCESGTRQVDLIINQPPAATFTNIGQCAGDTITFKGPKTNVASWTWDYGDGSANGADSTVHHIFNESRTFTVKLSVTSTTLPGNAVCTNSSFINLFVGFNPTIDVKYLKNCHGDITSFSYTSSPPLELVHWKFGDGNQISGNTTTTPSIKTPNYSYVNPGTYNLVLIGKTSIGCSDTVTKVLPILRKLAPTAASPYLMKTAMPGEESGYWQVETTVDSLSTWEFNIPNGSSMQWADSAWVTGASTPYKSNDVSYVNSPCFDITGFNRPLISLNYLHDVQNGRDGAILEYSTNSGVTWQKLGNPNTGLEWYDLPNPINALGNVFGWTGKDTTVQAGFHSLSGIAIANRHNVRFRIKFASDQDTEAEGFAFNNVNIVEKNRLVLVENFTNNSKSETVNHNTIFRNLNTFLSASEFVPLEYHIVPAGFGADAVNELNKADNNARAAFYGITQNVTGTQDGMLMGTFNVLPAGTNLKPAFEDEFNLRSLRSSPIELDIVTTNIANGQYKIDVTITALENISSNDPIAMYITLVEKVLDDPTLEGDNGETQYHYVLRKMLPSAVGKRITFPMTIGQTTTFSETITITDQLFNDINEMAIVAFVQNQNPDKDGRKDVWQAKIEANPTAPASITGNEPSFADLVSVYPVPVRNKMNIELTEKAKRAMPINLVDNFGREVYANQFKAGERLKVIETKDLSSGVYILQILSDKGELLRRKVVITND